MSTDASTHLESSAPTSPSTGLPASPSPESLAQARDRLRGLHQAMLRRDPVLWIEKNYFIKETSRPIVLERFQKAVLRYALQRNEDGSFRYQTVVWSQPKKSGKTAISGAVGRWAAETWGRYQQIFCVGNDAKQALERAFQSIRESIQLDPRYDPGRQSLPGEWAVLSTRLDHRSGSRISAVATDYRGEAGSNPSLSIWTELWGFTHRDALRFWAEMAPSPLRLNSLRWVETYAGYEGESELLEELYANIVVNGRQLTAGELGDPGCFAESPNPHDLVPIYVDDAAGAIAYWDDGDVARRMPWQQGPRGEQYYANEAATQTPKQMDRLHGNKWVSTETNFVAVELWDACGHRPPPPLLPGDQTPMVVALDAAITGDCFGLVGVTRDPDNPDEGVIVRVVHKWEPDGTPLDFEAVEQVVKRLAATYNVVQYAYDQYQLHDFATRLRKADVGWFKVFSQGDDRLKADKQLWDLIVNRRVRHDGNHDLRGHIMNANAKQSANEDTRLRIVKKSAKRHIDLAVCLSMASYECLRLSL